MRTLWKYLALVGVPLLILLAVLRVGSGLPLAAGAAAPSAAASSSTAPFDLARMVLQIAVVLAVARIAGFVFQRLRQPRVMGEMVAGIMLGPSLFGWLAPDASAALFPPGSLGYLAALSQLGLVLFIFLVGLRLDTKALRRHGDAAVVTSHVSIVAPFVLGAALALYLYRDFAPAGVAFPGFALFMGAAMSVTAFPVLARILIEKNLERTKVGAVAIACAAVDDVTAWCVLAGIVALVRASGAAAPGAAAGAHLPLWAQLAGTALYVGMMLVVARRALAPLGERVRRDGMTADLLALVVLFVLASAWATEVLGVHALFGAFLAGAVMPRDAAFAEAVAARLESVSVVLLLPLFFALTGLRTSVGLLDGAAAWLDCALIVAVAVAGKLGGSAIAARVSGMGWRDAAALGVLMNTRGLMELVILGIGLEIGVISPALFSAMVLMALATTFMASPLLDLVYPAARRASSLDTREPA